MANYTGPFPSVPELEGKFAHEGIKYRKDPAFVLDKLTVVEAAQVRGVTDRADPDTVKRYAESLKAGAILPAGVVAEIDGVTTKVDCFHRVEAAKSLGRTTYPMYVIMDASAEVLKAIALSQNASHGYLLSEAETLRAVAALVETGMTVEAVIRLTGVPRSKVDRAVHAFRFNNRVEALNLKEDQVQRLEALGQTARAALNRQVAHDSLFGPAVQLVVDSAMTGTEAATLSRSLAKVKSDDEGRALLATERAARLPQIERIARGYSPPRPGYVQQFRMHARVLVGLPPLESVDTNPATRADSAQLATDLFTYAEALRNAYNAVDCEPVTTNGTGVAAD